MTEDAFEPWTVPLKGRLDEHRIDSELLDLGAEAFRRALAGIGITDVFFELFDATHKAIEYRYPKGLRYLAERLSP